MTNRRRYTDKFRTSAVVMLEADLQRLVYERLWQSKLKHMSGHHCSFFGLVLCCMQEESKCRGRIYYAPKNIGFLVRRH